jgi:hypothetical protein
MVKPCSEDQRTSFDRSGSLVLFSDCSLRENHTDWERTVDLIERSCLRRPTPQVAIFPQEMIVQCKNAWKEAQ